MISNELQNLNASERELALQILNEISKNGKSKIYDDLLYSDYEEIPVDIAEAVTDVGKAAAVTLADSFVNFFNVLKTFLAVFPNKPELNSRYASFIRS